jgi:hypothetical protein
MLGAAIAELLDMMVLSEAEANPVMVEADLTIIFQLLLKLLAIQYKYHVLFEVL